MGRWFSVGLVLVMVGCEPARDGAAGDDASGAADGAEAGQTGGWDPDPDMDGISVFAYLDERWRVRLVFTNSLVATCEEPELTGEWKLDGSCPPRDVWAVRVVLEPPHDVPGPAQQGLGRRQQDIADLCRTFDSNASGADMVTLDVLSQDGIEGSVSLAANGSLYGDPLPPPSLHFSRPWCP